MTAVTHDVVRQGIRRPARLRVSPTSSVDQLQNRDRSWLPTGCQPWRERCRAKAPRRRSIRPARGTLSRSDRSFDVALQPPRCRQKVRVWPVAAFVAHRERRAVAHISARKAASTSGCPSAPTGQHRTRRHSASSYVLRAHATAEKRRFPLRPRRSRQSPVAVRGARPTQFSGALRLSRDRNVVIEAKRPRLVFRCSGFNGKRGWCFANPYDAMMCR